MFADISDLIAHNLPLLHYGVAATDLDGDGSSEFFVAGFGGPNRLLKWIDGILVDIADEVLMDVGRQAIGVAAGDIDGDGREELYILNTDTFSGPKTYADRLFDFRNGRWTDLFSLPENAPILNRTAGRSAAAIDRRGTGRYGFVIANYGAPVRLYELSARDRLLNLAPSLGMDTVTGGRSLLPVPLFGAAVDLLTGNEHDRNMAFINRGDGSFEESARQLGLSDPTGHTRGMTIVDLGDHVFGVCVGNWQGRNRLFALNGEDRFMDIAPSSMARPSRVRNVIAADFNNDGFQELFFNTIGQPNRLFGQQDGEWIELDLGSAVEPDGLGTGAAIADIDDDGRLELLIAHGESAPQPLSLYKSVETENAWIRVAPLTRLGAPARGARVMVLSNGRTQTRMIDGGSGYLCQMEPIAHFGLGECNKVDRIIVSWPCGARLEVDDPPLRKTLNVAFPVHAM
ncbi:MAG: CRTAC1 family protein [Pseudomonadota bacterium]